MLKRFLCWLGWHKVPMISWFHVKKSVSLHGTCSRCERELLMDSQGNWF